jgi:cytochrome c biogenesis protein CcdA/glutaredoxin
MLKKIALTLLFLVALGWGASPVLAQESTACFYYFWGDGCSQCEKIEPFIEGLSSQYSSLRIEKFEIYHDQENALRLNEYLEGHNVPQSSRGVPAVFLGERYLIGENAIRENLEKELAANPTTVCPLPSSSGTGISGEPCSLTEGCPVEEQNLPNLITVIGAALVDSINPCAIAVLLILLSAFLLGAGKKKRALAAGLAFTGAIYLAYFLFGLGIFSVIQVSGLSDLVYRLVGILAIIVGLLNIKDYFWYGGGGFAMEIPRSWRHTLKDIIYKATSPLGAFLVGFVVVLFELPCTGGPYFFVLGLLAKSLTLAGAVPYLLLYNVFFVLPLLLILGLVFWGYSTVEKAAQWKERNTRLLHLVAGVVLTFLGVAVFLRLV